MVLQPIIVKESGEEVLGMLEMVNVGVEVALGPTADAIMEMTVVAEELTAGEALPILQSDGTVHRYLQPSAEEVAWLPE